MIKFQLTMFILFVLATQIHAQTQLEYQSINDIVKYNIESNETLFVIAFRGQEVLKYLFCVGKREYLFCRIKNCECEERVAIGQRSHPKLNDQKLISNYQCQDGKISFDRKDNNLEPYIWNGQEQNKQIRITQETTTTSTTNGNTDYSDSDMTATLTVDSLFSMKWKFNTDDTIEMCYILNQKSWIGIGFGEGMKNVDMLTINIIDSTANVLDLWSTKDDTPVIDSSQDITLISYSISDTVFKARIKRKLSTSDTSQDTILAKAGTYTWSYATSSNLVMEDHGHNFEEFSVTLSETGNYVSYQNILQIFIMILYLLS